jgi:sugar lactone lactonase YvrE
MSTTADLVLDARDGTGECPVWDDQARALWWTDIPGRRLHRLDVTTGAYQTYAMPGRVGAFALRRSGGLVLAMERGFSTFDPETGSVANLAQPEAHLENHRMNDGRCDRAGRFLAGSMNLDRSGPTGVLWRLDASGEAARVTDGAIVSNGLAFSLDGRRMYWSDSTSDRVWTFDYDQDAGVASNRQLWLGPGSAPGRPDGATVDAEGSYWSARWLGGRVVRFTPQGKVDREIRLPASRVTMLAFGGRDLRTLYITTAREGMNSEELEREPLAGGLFAVEIDIPGLAEPRFAG